jgi:mannose-6-phosphate isomerase-like protein (cupin superfamily)
VEEAIHSVTQLQEIDRTYCRRRVEENFTIDRMVDEYIEVYEQILEKTKCEDQRPWGYYKILANNDTYKSKEIVIWPGERLSLQRHRHRSEHWYILEGQAQVTVDDQTFELLPGQSVDIGKGAMHRIANPGTENIRFIEVQMGDYFGEDDVERFEDDYGRT